MLTFHVSGSFGEDRHYNRTVQRINRSLDELAALPQVETAATTTTLPGVPFEFVVEFNVVELRDENAATKLAGCAWYLPAIGA